MNDKDKSSGLKAKNNQIVNNVIIGLFLSLSNEITNIWRDLVWDQA